MKSIYLHVIYLSKLISMSRDSKTWVQNRVRRIKIYMKNLKHLVFRLYYCVKVMGVSQECLTHDGNFFRKLIPLNKILVIASENIDKFVFARESKVRPIEAVSEIEFIYACLNHCRLWVKICISFFLIALIIIDGV